MKWYNPFTWTPFTQPGRQTLVYLMFAGAGPALLGAIMWFQSTIRNWTDAPVAQRLDRYAEIAVIIAWSLFIVVLAYCAFAAFRSLKFNLKDGIDMNARDDGPSDQVLAGAAAGAMAGAVAGDAVAKSVPSTPPTGAV